VTKLQVWAAEGLRSGAFEELHELVTRRAFESWINGEERTDHENRTAYRAQSALVQILENLAQEAD
jgi:hypothetical protein